MQLTQGLRSAVQQRPDTDATVACGRTRTWREVGERVPRLAAGLRALGVAPGDRVAILAMNSDLYVEAFYAIAWAGAVSVPLNTRWAQAENVYALRDCGATALLADRMFIEAAAALCRDTGCGPLVLMDEGPVPAGIHAWDGLVTAHAPMPDACGSYDDLMGIFYTGGTTGSPKGVMLSHRNVVFEAIVWVCSLHFKETTRYLNVAGLFHLAGASPVFALTLVGGTHIVLPKFEPEAAMAAIHEHRANYCLFVPTMIGMMLNHPGFGRYDLSSVEDCEYGASPMPDALLLRTMEQLPTWRLHQGYGLTECAALATLLPWSYHAVDGPLADKRRSAGRAAIGVEVRIVDPDGAELPRGEVGEIAIRSAGVMLGYWGKPAETAKVIRNGWLHTGDGARMDADGFVYIVDRVKDMIVSGGENVYSGEVEQAIYRHPAVRECAVIAVPNATWGESVHAIVVPHDGRAVGEAEIVAHCRTLIAGYKCPRSVEIRPEPLPLSAAGKILKAQLRAERWAGQTRQVA